MVEVDLSLLRTMENEDCPSTSRTSRPSGAGCFAGSLQIIDDTVPIAGRTFRTALQPPVVTGVIIVKVVVVIIDCTHGGPGRIALDVDDLILPTFGAGVSKAFLETHHSTAMIAAAMIERSVMTLMALGLVTSSEPVAACSTSSQSSSHPAHRAAKERQS